MDLTALVDMLGRIQKEILIKLDSQFIRDENLKNAYLHIIKANFILLNLKQGAKCNKL